MQTPISSSLRRPRPTPQRLAGNALDQNPNIEGNQRKSWKFTVK
jgi:hypothetical protein